MNESEFKRLVEITRDKLPLFIYYNYSNNKYHFSDTFKKGFPCYELGVNLKDGETIHIYYGNLEDSSYYNTGHSIYSSKKNFHMFDDIKRGFQNVFEINYDDYQRYKIRKNKINKLLNK